MAIVYVWFCLTQKGSWCSQACLWPLERETTPVSLSTLVSNAIILINLNSQSSRLADKIQLLLEAVTELLQKICLELLPMYVFIDKKYLSKSYGRKDLLLDGHAESSSIAVRCTWVSYEMGGGFWERHFQLEAWAPVSRNRGPILIPQSSLSPGRLTSDLDFEHGARRGVLPILVEWMNEWMNVWVSEMFKEFYF